MFHTILVAVDRSDVSRQGFDAALDLAQAIGAGLVLVHVLSVEDEEAPRRPNLIGQDFYPRGSSRSVTQIYADLWQAYEERGWTLLRSLADEATAKEIAVELIQSVGQPGPKICELALTLAVDLIILGRQGQGSGFNAWLLGSVSNYVLHHAPCSVLVVPRQSRPPLTHPSEPPTAIAAQA